ncbi:hypothetical protein BOX15_Mlig021767g2 [Macrostomum lignano]|uniref:ceramide glucosyltransferase n=1 Tax=Macrostomum lignano TaxID=282301 RepID=A0A267DXJ7_9PLAT|nr:hypothetical protein BOX15_Mlig021767g2 [Macrostomum lignano]
MPYYNWVYFVQLAIVAGVMVILFLLVFSHTMAIIFARSHFYKKVAFEPAAVEAGLPGVSIIKPLVGIDKNVYSNLETYFRLDYPRYELLFCLESADDAVTMVVDTLMQKYPKVDTRVFTSPVRHNVNPKINNMMQGYSAAKYDLVMVSDSGVKMRPEALMDMVWCMSQKDIGIVHQMPFIEQRPGFRNLAHSTHFGCTHAKFYISAHCLGINCCTGMSCLLRKPIIDKKPGGLAYFGRYLAEDFFVAQHFIDNGYKMTLSHYPALQDGSGEVRGLRRRLIRWLQLRVAMVPQLVVLEMLAECLVSGAMGAWAFAFLLPSLVNPIVYLLTHCLIWLLADYTLLCSCLDPAEPLMFSRLAFMFTWLFSIGTQPITVVRSLFHSEIVWRDKRFRLQWGGNTVELPGLPVNLSAAKQAV